MKESILRTRSFGFALRILKLYQHLANEKREYVLSKQILRSGTSVGANIEEAGSGTIETGLCPQAFYCAKEACETELLAAITT